MIGRVRGRQWHGMQDARWQRGMDVTNSDRLAALRRRLATPQARKRGRIVLVALLLLAAGSMLAVPPLVQRALVADGSASLSRPVSVARVAFNPLTLTLTFTDLAVRERDGTAPFFDVGELRADLSFTSLFRRALVLDALVLDRPVLHLSRDEPQRFNFSDLLEAPTAPGGADAPPPQPLRYAVANIEVHDGRIEFDDRVTPSRHTVQKIEVGIPFLANLPSAASIRVEPLLAFELDGHPQRIDGHTKPFHESLESTLELHLNAVDLPTYASYVPGPLPVRVESGTLSGALKLRFLQNPGGNELGVSGIAVVDGLVLQEPDGGPLLSLTQIETSLTDVQPLRGYARLGRVVVHGPTLELVRGGRQGGNLERVLAPGPAPARTAAPATTAATPAQPLDVAIATLALHDGTLRLRDSAIADAAPLEWSAIELALQGLATTGTTPATLTLQSTLAGGTLGAKGTVLMSANRAELDLSADALALPAFDVLMRPILSGRVSRGALGGSAHARVDFGDQPDLLLEPAQATIGDFAFGAAQDPDPPVQWRKLDVRLARAVLAEREVALGPVALDGLRLHAKRARDGRIDLESLLLPPSRTLAATPAGEPERPAAPAEPEPTTPAADRSRDGWRTSIERFTLGDGEVLVDDSDAESPVKLHLAPLDLEIGAVGTDLSKPTAVNARGGFGRKGEFEFDGTVAPSPLDADLAVSARLLNVAAFGPYVSQDLNATIVDARLSARGQLRAQSAGGATRLRYRGDATLGDVKLIDKVSSDDFVSWNALAATAIDLDVGADAPKVAIGELALSNFYSRVIVNASGRLNLQDVIAKPDQQPTSLTRAEPSAGPQAPLAPATPVTPPPAAGSPPGAPGAASPAAPLPDIRFGKITLQGGRVSYTDNFIKPNFGAELVGIGGSVGGFGTRSTEPAELVLAGSLGDASPVEITGKINPIAPTAFVDIAAKMSALQLTQLTPYSAKYAGYTIEKGILNMDVRYKLEQRRLSAENHLFIDQLTFGEKVESPDATKLPVKLAVALLQNSRGEIDVRIPVSGSVDDPKFSLGRVVFQAFMNAVVSVITSPFRLLASAFGGGDEELSYAEFAPGSAELTPEAHKRLELIAKALADRPALKLDIIGRIDPELDRPGLREAELAARVRAEKVRETAGKRDEEAPAAAVAVEPEEYERYLEAVYKAADFPKPRNAIGLVKSLPAEEMTKLLLANIEIADDDLATLAERRAEAARAVLAASIPTTRLFINAVKLDGKGIEDKGATTRVDFSLH